MTFSKGYFLCMKIRRNRDNGLYSCDIFEVRFYSKLKYDARKKIAVFRLMPHPGILRNRIFLLYQIYVS